MHTGCIVKIRPEWEGGYEEYLVVEWNGDRGFIQPVVWSHGGIRPTEIVTTEMVEFVSEKHPYITK
jgi:hypothetical protein